MVDLSVPLPESAAAPQADGRVRRPTRGALMVLTGALLFVVNAGVSRVVLRAGVDPGVLTALRTAGAALVLGTVLAVLRPGSLRLRRREIPLVLAYGIAGVAMVQFLYFVAIGRLPVGVALLLEYTAPVWIALFARVVLRERVRRTVWVALGLSLVGLALVAQAWNGDGLDGVGVLAGLGAGLAFATYFLVGEAAVVRRDPYSLSFWGFAVAAVFWSVLRPWWHGLGGLVGADTSLLGGLSQIHLPVWLLVLWIVVLGTLAPFVIETAALRHIPATAAGVVAMVEPVGAALLARIWFGEALAGVQLVGGAVVLAGIVLAQTARGR